MNLVHGLLLEAADNAAADQSVMQTVMLVLMVVGVGAMFFFSSRKQRKQKKEEQKMRNDLRIGDQITTIGGIRGRVLKIGEDELVLETGADRNKITIKKWAIQLNETVHDTPAPDDDDDDD